MLAVLGLGCCGVFGDPSLVYSVPGWRAIQHDGRRYERNVDPGVKVRVYNSGFGGSFRLDMDIFNDSSEDLVFDGTVAYLVDRRGSRLPSETADDQQCSYSPPPPARVPPGGYLEGRCEVRADLCKMPRDLTIVQNGLSLNARAVPLAIRMTSDE